MTSPFEESLRSLNEVAKECRVDLQSVFVNTQAEAEIFSAELRRSAQAVIDGIKAKLPPPVCVIRRQRRQTRNSRKKSRSKSKKLSKKVHSQRTVVKEVSVPTEIRQVELESDVDAVKESIADDHENETGGSVHGIDANAHRSTDANTDGVSLMPPDSPKPVQPRVKFGRTIVLNQSIDGIDNTSDIARESGKTLGSSVRTPRSTDGASPSQSAKSTERIPNRDNTSVQLENCESNSTSEGRSEPLHSSQLHDPKLLENANQVESTVQAEQNRRSSATTSSFYSAIDELDSAVLKNSKSEYKTPQLPIATIEQNCPTRETLKNEDPVHTQSQPSTPTKPSEDVPETGHLSSNVSTQLVESPPPKSAVNETFERRKSSPHGNIGKLNDEHKLPENHASEGNNSASCAHSSSGHDRTPAPYEENGARATLSPSAFQTSNPVSPSHAQEVSSTHRDQQPEVKSADGQICRLSRSSLKSQADPQGDAGTGTNVMGDEKKCTPDVQVSLKRSRQPNSSDDTLPEKRDSLDVDSGNVNNVECTALQDSTDRELAVQHSPHLQDARRIETDSQVEEESAKSQDCVQDAVADGAEVRSPHPKSSDDRKKSVMESTQVLPSIEAKLDGPKPVSLPNHSKTKSTGEPRLASSLNETASPETSPKFPVPKVSRAASKRIVVDRDGKVDQESLGMLSKIAANAVNTASEAENPPLAATSEKLQSLRTRLYIPTNNIYALSKPSASGSVQRYTASSRSSILSHTPGAHLPFKPASNEPSLGERMAAVNERFQTLEKNQPIESRPGHVRPDEGSNIGIGLTTAKDHKKEMRLVHKRGLTFAEPDERPLAQIALNSAPVGVKQRTRFNAKPKSSLRVKVEEIMTGKSNDLGSTPSVSSAAMIPSFSQSVLPTYSKSKSVLDPLKVETRDDVYSTDRPASQSQPDQDLANIISDDVRKVRTPSEAPTSIRVPVVRKPAVPLLQESSRKATFDDEDAKQSILGAANENEAATAASLRETKALGAEEVEEEGTKIEVEEIEEKRAPLGNLMTSITSFIPGASSFLGSRAVRERSDEEDEAEAAAKRQKLDMERREAELQARREAQRLLRQKETEDKQRRAERRRRQLAQAEREKEEERRRKEERRVKKRLEEEELRKKKKAEEDRKREERRRLVLEKRAQNQAKQKRLKKGADSGGVRKFVKDGLSSAGGGGTHVAGVVEVGDGGEEDDGRVGGAKGCGGAPHTPVRRKADSNVGPSTYMMTPAHETVMEHSDEEEERRKHKQIPRWAQGRKLSTAARAQADPDEVFVNVPTCDLREVFGNGRRFRARTSSANWARDRVTSQEMMKFRKGQAAFREEKR